MDQVIAQVAKAIPGHLGEENWENPSTGLISNMYYRKTLESLQMLMTHPAHIAAKQRQGQWLQGYRVVIAQVLGCHGDKGIAHLLARVVLALHGLTLPNLECSTIMSFLAFLVAAVILAITPGPGIAYVVARTVAGGRAAGLASCIGTGIGGLLHVLAAALGLSLLVAQSAMAFNLVKYLGAAYLIYLGICLLLRKEQTFTLEAEASQGARRALLEGIVVEALNVKTALFFLAFLPQFTSSGTALVPQLILLGSTCVVLNTLVDVVAVFAAHGLLESGEARAARARVLTRASGVTMVGLGAFLALARREP